MTATEQDLRLTRTPIAETAMLIRRPAAEVFAAFADPAITTRFWFTRSSGPLAPGARVRWEWGMYGVGAGVVVTDFVPDRRIAIEWGDEHPTTVVWDFAPHGPDATYVTITNSGFLGDGDARVAQALDAVGGFALVLAGLKAWLERGLALNLVADRHPAALVME